MTDTATLAPAGASPVASEVPASKPESVSVPVPASGEKQDPATPAEAAAPQTEGKSDQGDPAAENPEEKAEADRKRESFKERIDRERARKHEAERRATAAERNVANLEKQLAELRQQYQKLDPSDAEGQQALATRHAVKAERLEQLRAEQESAGEEAAQSRQAMFNSKVEAARATIPDFDTVMQNWGHIPVSSESAELIASSERAAEIAYYLAKNPGVAARINGLPPHMQGAEIARIEAAVTPPPPRKPSQAPKPITTNIGAGSQPAVKTQDNWDGADWSAWAKKLGGKR